MKRLRADSILSDNYYEINISRNEIDLVQILCPKEQHEIDKIKKSYKKCKRKTV